MTLNTTKQRARNQTPVLPYTREVRLLTTDAEVRDSADGDGWTLDVGFAPFNSEARINDGVGEHGYFMEKFTPTTFDRTDFSQCVAIEGHNRAARPFGSVAAGTMSIYKGAAGMRYSVKLDPASPDHQSIRVAVQRGDYNGSSLCMLVDPSGDTWKAGNDGVDQRTINAVESVLEVSLTPWPAYKDTDATVRSQAPDTRKRLKQLHTQMQAELRVGKTLSAATSAAITAALGHVTQAGDHLSSVLQPDVGGVDGSEKSPGGLNGAGYPLDANTPAGGRSAASAAAAFARDRFAMDRRRIALFNLARAEGVEDGSVLTDDRDDIEDRTERIAEVLATKPYQDPYLAKHPTALRRTS